MKNIFFVVACILYSFNCFAQTSNNVWAMGYECCNLPFYGMNLDFTTGSLQIDTVQRQMNFNKTNAQFFDSQNRLLFCSNGIYVANSIDDTMLNGDGLNPCPFTSNHSSFPAPGLTIPQANLVIPFPDDSMKYYLFHESLDDYGNTNASFYLYYSVIDMTLDGGLGAVIQKNTVLLNDTLIPGGLTACKHANGRDWWIVAHEYKGPQGPNNPLGLAGVMYKFLITPYGILTPDTQDLHALRGRSECVFTPAGDKFATYEPNTDLDIWDFDRCTGNFSNNIHIVIDDSTIFSGAAFSPSGKYLYITSSGVNSAYVYQFDVLATDVSASKQIIAVRDSLADFNLAQLGPNSKIYIIGSPRYIHVINYPDSAGPACGFCQRCIFLPAYNNFTIPNHPNYFLGAASGTLCDSLHIDVPSISSSIQSFNLFPNPVRNVLYITQSRKEIIKSLTIFNSIGQEQSVNYSSIKNGEYVEINANMLSPGIYFLEMMTEKQKVVKRFVKE